MWQVLDFRVAETAVLLADVCILVIIVERRPRDVDIAVRVVVLGRRRPRTLVAASRGPRGCV